MRCTDPRGPRSGPRDTMLSPLHAGVVVHTTLCEPCVADVAASIAPLRVGRVGSIIRRHEVEYSTDPRGPRSGPSCAVSVHRHLVDPIRPTRRHSTISPHGGLYALSSLCGSA